MESPLTLSVRDAVWCRDAAGAHGTSTKDRSESRDKQDREHERAIRCSRCGTPITSAKQRIGRDGKHLHTVLNPAGIVFEIGCFREAQGCLAHGPASLEFSWFAGYSWRVAFCSACAEHLGWYFSAGDDAFWGLIVNRLLDA